MTRQNSASGNRNFRWEGCNDDSVDSLDRISLDATATTILDVSSNVPGVYRRLYDVNVEDSEQFQKPQKLAERTEALSPAKAAIFFRGIG